MEVCDAAGIILAPQVVDIETVAASIRKNRDQALAAAAQAAAAMAPGLLIDTDPLDGPPPWR